jgi:hypothetical protein
VSDVDSVGPSWGSGRQGAAVDARDDAGSFGSGLLAAQRARALPQRRSPAGPVRGGGNYLDKV